MSKDNDIIVQSAFPPIIIVVLQTFKEHQLLLNHYIFLFFFKDGNVAKRIKNNKNTIGAKAYQGDFLFDYLLMRSGFQILKLLLEHVKKKNKQKMQ